MALTKRMLSLCLACVLASTAFTVPDGILAQETAEETGTEAPVTDAVQVFPEGQLTPEDISAYNNGKEMIFSHDDRVTFIDGTCTDSPVMNAEEAAAVVDSVMTLIGADERTEFVPWSEAADPLGNVYYIFQQMYGDTTVCGGAVKVITDADGNMIALSSSVESEMPDASDEAGIEAAEAERIVLETEYKRSGTRPDILDSYTGKVILPVVLEFDVENEDESNRFVWVVYTGNTAGNSPGGSELPYLAHYVSMSGEYLYSMPAILPGDEAGMAGYDSAYIFEFMEPADYTGYVDLSDGTEKELSVTVMRDRRTGMYYLGNIERRILVAESYDFLFHDGQVVLESSPDNREWNQTGLLSLYNYCRAYDYYSEIGLTSPDGRNTPILILNNFCDDHYNEVDNAAYLGKLFGMQCFAASKINDFSQCLDVIGHEFTHCVTSSLMTYTSYTNDYGAINEAFSDIQGRNCSVMAGDTEPDDWSIASRSVTTIRDMSNPHKYGQPEFTWDLYYQARVGTPTPMNDYGGVHTNSSLLNRVAYLLQSDGGMTPEETRLFWYIASCAMVPGMDHLQLTELLPWVLKTAGMDKYTEVLAEALDLTRLSVDTMPESMENDRAIITLTLPATEAFDADNWSLQFLSIRFDKFIARVITLVAQFRQDDFSSLPESVQQLIKDARADAEAKGTEVSEEKEDLVSLLLTAVPDVLETFLAEASDEEQDPSVTPEASDEAPVTEGEPDVDPALLEEAEQAAIDIRAWLQEELSGFVFLSSASAGQDGSLIKMVVRPGRAIPFLMHATVDGFGTVPQEVVYAIYLNGKWYDLGLGDLVEGKESDDFDLPPILTDLFSSFMEKVDSIDGVEDVLDLFSLDVKGGKVLELSAEGLDQIVIPPRTEPEDMEYAVMEPGPKSRPKEETETTETTADTTEEAADETGTADEAAEETGTADETAEEAAEAA